MLDELIWESQQRGARWKRGKVRKGTKINSASQLVHSREPRQPEKSHKPTTQYDDHTLVPRTWVQSATDLARGRARALGRPIGQRRQSVAALASGRAQRIRCSARPVKLKGHLVFECGALLHGLGMPNCVLGTCTNDAVAQI